MDDSNIFGKTIRAARTEKNISQTQLAKNAKINRSYLSLIENGHRLPTLKILRKIGAALGGRFKITLVEKDPPGFYIPRRERG